MDQSERDMVIRVEQKIKDSFQNQKTLLDNQREIFQKLERDSKQLSVLSGDMKSHIESTKVRWENAKQQIEDMEKNIEENEKAIENENKERSNFETSVSTSFKTSKTILYILVSAATIISAITAILVFVNRGGTL